MALLDEELLPFFGNPNIQRQGARARALAAQRSVNTLPDPRTYALISGLLGEAPDEMGFSVLNPDYEDIQRVARPAFAVGTALGIAPLAGAVSTSKAAMRAGRAGERMAERAVPRIMGQGGLPAEMLQAMAQGSRSQMFIGPSSPMFNKQMAFEATKLSKRGKTPQEIWQQTGTVKGPDGQWRQEISDDLSTMKGAGAFEKTIMNAYERGRKKTGDQLYKTTVDDVFFHNQLSQAYPELMRIETQMMPKGKTARGSLSGTSDGQILRMQETLPSNDARSTMLHELQHGIQEREGFAVGGNTRDFAAMRAKALDQIGNLNTQMSALAKQMENKALPKAQQDALRAQYDQAMEARQGLVSNASIDPMQAYGNLMGEAEARLTQRRMNLNPQQRKENFPFQYTGETGFGLDVPLEGLIYMDQSGSILDRGLLGR
jgi:hypothetical protein